MLFVLFQVVLVVKNIKICWPQFRFAHWWTEWGAIIILTVIQQWVAPLCGHWMWLPAMLSLIVVVTWVTRAWRTAVVMSIESMLLLCIVLELTMLVSPHWSYMMAIPVTFFGFGLVGLGLVCVINRWLPTSTMAPNNLVVGLVSLAYVIVVAYLQLINETPKATEVWLALGLTVLLIVALLGLQKTREHLLNQTMRVQQQRALLTSNLRYTQAVEHHYDELRRFRHDYQNVMLSLDGYIKTDDFVGLKQYYQTALMPKQAQLTATKYQLEDLARIESKAIKSILFNKLNDAQQQDIQVQLEVATPITRFVMPTVDLVIALGILLDNAIEATQTQSAGWVHVAVIESPTSQVILVKNSLETELPPLWQLEQAGYSTKGTDRGLGLTNLKTIVDQYATVSLTTDVTAATFSQQLILKWDESHD